MTLPLLDPMPLSGFEHKGYFLFLLVVLAMIGLYVVAQLARQRRLLRFANLELLDSVAPERPSRWRPRTPRFRDRAVQALSWRA